MKKTAILEEEKELNLVRQESKQRRRNKLSLRKDIFCHRWKNESKGMMASGIKGNDCEKQFQLQLDIY